jgi:hypothetical protein
MSDAGERESTPLYECQVPGVKPRFWMTRATANQASRARDDYGQGIAVTLAISPFPHELPEAGDVRESHN